MLQEYFQTIKSVFKQLTNKQLYTHTRIPHHFSMVRAHQGYSGSLLPENPDAKLVDKPLKKEENSII